MSVPIRLSWTDDAVAFAPEISTPLRGFPEMTFPGPMTVLGEKSATPSCALPLAASTVGGHADQVVERCCCRSMWCR